MSGYVYQRTGHYFGQLAAGAEECGADELRRLGAEHVKPGHLGLYFCASPRTVLETTYRSRILSRVLAPLVVFDCHSAKYLYKTAQQVDWSEFLGPEHTFAVAANVADSHIRNSQYAALVLKDAIADQFRERTGARPSVDTRTPDLPLNLYIHANKARISVDLGGGSLHQRGYRAETVAAPMRETLAAAILQLSEWQGGRPLHDPFCGSGTLLCEAWMKAAGIPAAFLRKRFGFMRLPDFDAALWRQAKHDADAAIRAVPDGLVAGSDIDPAAVQAVRANRAALPAGAAIQVRRADFRSLDGFKDATIVANPPYGIRLGEREQAAALLKEFGDFLKQKCTGCDAFVYFGDAALAKRLGLKPAWKKSLRNGALDGVLCKYALY